MHMMTADNCQQFLNKFRLRKKKLLVKEMGEFDFVFFFVTDIVPTYGGICSLPSI